MKVFFKVLAAIFSIAISAGAVIIFFNGFETFIQSFCNDPIGMIFSSLGIGLLVFIFSFGPLNEFIDDCR